MKTQQPTLKVSLKTHGRGCMLSKCFRTKYICICFLLPKNCVERKQVENHTIQWLDSNQTKLVWMVGGSGVWKINVSQRGDWGSIVLLNINCWSQLNGLWHRQPVNTVIIGWCAEASGCCKPCYDVTCGILSYSYCLVRVRTCVDLLLL